MFRSPPWPYRGGDDRDTRIMVKSKILKGRLPPEDSSVRRETLGKRVSDDFAKMIFRGEKVFRGDIFWKNRKFRRAVFFLSGTARHGAGRGGSRIGVSLEVFASDDSFYY